MFRFLRFTLGAGWRMVWKRMRREVGRRIKRLYQNSLGEVIMLALPQYSGDRKKRYLCDEIYST